MRPRLDRMEVGIAGLGTIGTAVARALDGGIDGLRLAAIATRTREKALARMEEFSRPVPILTLQELAKRVNVVVECVPTAAFTEVALPALEAGCILITVSGGALMQHLDLVELAKRSGGRIILATGALLGLDAIRAAAEGRIDSVTMVTRKPPRALAGAPYLETHNIDITDLREPLKVFEGSAAEAALGFPANVNVAAAVGLAGIGTEATRLEIWADPHLNRNTHTITVEANSARFEMRIENVPTDENPATGTITALSVIDTLRGLVNPLRVGS